jgi:hypothetical protein
MANRQQRFKALLESAAADRLGIDRARPVAETRARLLRELRDAGFLPDAATHDALKLFHNRAVHTGALVHDTRLAEEARLHGEVEVFAAGFFGMPVKQRRTRWQELSEACEGYPALEERLEALSPGLNVDRGRFRDRSPAVTLLANDIFTLFILPPSRRAEISRTFDERLSAEKPISERDLRGAIPRLRGRHRSVAALASGYLDDVHDRFSSSMHTRRMRRFAQVLRRDASLNPIIAVLIVVVPTIAGLLAVVAARGPGSMPYTPPVITPPTPPSSKAFEITLPVDNARPSTGWRAIFHDEFKRSLARELAKHGKTLDDARLQKVVNHLPDDVAQVPLGLAIRILLGKWSQRDHDRCVAGLADGLKEAKLDLSPKQLDAIASGAVPSAPAPNSGSSSESSRRN